MGLSLFDMMMEILSFKYTIQYDAQRYVFPCLQGEPNCDFTNDIV